MTKYKIGDVAALFSKPKSPTTTGGKKLQSLFEDYYSKKSSPTFYSQEASSGINKTEEDKEVDEKSVSKKSRKRKLCSFDDSQLNENASSKKFKKSSEQNGSANVEHKKQKLKKLKDFPRKKNKNFSLNNNVFSNKFEESYEQKEKPDNKGKKFKMQQDFPRKNKPSKSNSFSTNSIYPKFETENNSENDSELPSSSQIKNVQKENKKNKNFIKKSKKKQSLDQNSNKLSNDISYKDSDDGDDASLRKEIKEFMHSNSVNKEMKRSNDKEEKAFNLKGQDIMGKQKKKFLANKSSFQNYEASPEKGLKSKKKNKKHNTNQLDFPMTVPKTNSSNFNNMESKTKYEGFKQQSPSKKQNSFEQVSGKKSKKKKHDLNVNSDATLENNSEINITKNKTMDFKRTPKSKIDYDVFGNDNFKKSNSRTFSDLSEDKKLKNEDNNNKIQKGQIKGFEVEAPDFIKLPSLNEDNEESNEERLSRTLFVGNLPKTISKQELKNLFSSFGVVVAVRLPGIETDKAKIFGKNPPKLLHSNYASDTVPGFVVFKEKQCAVEALKLSGSVFKSHHITVDFALPAGTHKLYDEKRSIFIGNLPFNVKDESIWNAFNHCGRIEGVRVVRDRQTGLGKGFGYVLFSTVEAKQKALALDSLSVEGREIRIKAVDSNKKTQKSGSSPSTKRDTFKSRAIRMKKNSNVTSGHKTIRKLTNKQKMLHKKKKTAEILQKAMK